MEPPHEYGEAAGQLWQAPDETPERSLGYVACVSGHERQERVPVPTRYWPGWPQAL